MIVDAIIPAYNEGPRVATVIRPVLASGVFRRVVVVDDGSTDDTAAIASNAGASVMRLWPNRRKGGAMFAALQATDADAVAFFDADLVGLTADHVRALVAPVVTGGAAMAVGMRDHGPVWTQLQAGIPPLTGERVVTRDVWERVPDSFWNGFRVEMGLNAAARGRKVVAVPLTGMTITPKWGKVGIKRGLEDAARMIVEILAAARDAQTIHSTED